MGKYLLIGISFTGVLYFFFFRTNDEQYIKKTTLHIIDQMAEPANVSQMASILRRVKSITEPMYFGVELSLSQDGRVLVKEDSLNQVRSLLATYFKEQPRFQLKKITEDDMKFSMNKTKDQKSASLQFLVQGGAQGKNYSCQVHMDWQHDEEWKIHKIKAFSCENLKY